MLSHQFKGLDQRRVVQFSHAVGGADLNQLYLQQALGDKRE